MVDRCPLLGFNTASKIELPDFRFIFSTEVPRSLVGLPDFKSGVGR